MGEKFSGLLPVHNVHMFRKKTVHMNQTFDNTINWALVTSPGNIKLAFALGIAVVSFGPVERFEVSVGSNGGATSETGGKWKCLRYFLKALSRLALEGGCKYGRVTLCRHMVEIAKAVQECQGREWLSNAAPSRRATV